MIASSSTPGRAISRPTDPPAPQKLALAVRDVFIENDHDPVIRV